MILRAIIENQEDAYHYRVRIPVLNKSKDAVASTSYDDLYVATVCTLPGIKISYAQGDIVFVGFERNDVGRPVILGQLQRDATIESATDMVVDSLTCQADLNVSGDLNLTNKARQDFISMVEKINEA